MKSTYPHILPDIKDWPIYQISESRASFIEELNAFTKSRLYEGSQVTKEEILDKTIYLEKLRVRNNPWKVDPVDDKEYWTQLAKEIERAKQQNNSDELLDMIINRIINRYNQEIVGNFKIKTFNFSRKFLTSFFKRLLNPARSKEQKGLWGNRKKVQEKLKVTGHIEELRSLCTKGTVVIVPTHFSNLDSVLIGYALDAVVGVPAFSYGAGLNLLDNELVAYFINRLGAYRVDRRKKNPIYLECLKAMASFSLQKGVNQIFFPGGTRSRSGCIEDKLKLGLLGSVVEAQRYAITENQNNKIYVVPLVLGYHYVLEAQGLINQYLRATAREKYTRTRTGKPSSKISKFLWNIISKDSEITLSFGQPMDVFGNYVDGQGRSLDKYGREVDISGYFKLDDEIKTVPQREKVYTKMLGDRILASYLVNNVVLSSHLVAFAAFKALLYSHSELGVYDVLNIPTTSFRIKRTIFEEILSIIRHRLLELEEKGKLKLSDEVRGDVSHCLEHGLQNLGQYHPEKVLVLGDDDEITSENFRLLLFYHNRLDAYELEKCVDWKKYVVNMTPELENETIDS